MFPDFPKINVMISGGLIFSLAIIISLTYNAILRIFPTLRKHIHLIGLKEGIYAYV